MAFEKRATGSSSSSSQPQANQPARRTPTTPTSPGPSDFSSNAGDDNDDLPPGYSMSAPAPDPAALRNAALGRMIPGNVPTVNFSAYAPLGSDVSTDLTTTQIVNPALCSSPQAFARVLAEQIALVPVPEIRVVGTHNQYGKTEVDFDIRINMMRYFLPKDGSPSLHYTQLQSAGKDRIGTPGVEEWARSFCINPATDKR
jgi:hypothetical protein